MAKGMGEAVSDASRWLDANAAAAYLHLSTEGFRRKAREGVIPAPSRVLGSASLRWDRQALDAAMEGGIASTNPIEAAEAFVQKTLAQGRTRRS
jgi:predicted DNA-binding transcriptional regulator AlpA